MDKSVWGHRGLVGHVTEPWTEMAPAASLMGTPDMVRVVFPGAVFMLSKREFQGIETYMSTCNEEQTQESVSLLQCSGSRLQEASGKAFKYLRSLSRQVVEEKR